jgi:hypothetical protein
MGREEIAETIARAAIRHLFGREWSIKGWTIKWPGVVCVGNAVPPPDADELHVTAIAWREDHPNDAERIVKLRLDNFPQPDVTVLKQGVVPAGESDAAFERCHNACITVAMLEKFLKSSLD